MRIGLAAVIGCAVLSWPLLAQGGFDGPGVYEIASIKSGKVLDLDRNDQTTVIQFSSRGTDNQIWEIRPAGAGYFSLRNGMNGYALDAGGGGNSEPVRGVPFNGGPSQQWRFDSGKDGNALIVSRYGKALDIPDGTSRDGVRVQIYDANGDSNQRFAFRRVSGGRRGGDWDRRGWDDDRRGAGTIACSSNHGERVYCDADTRNGVALMHQISGTPCREGSTWGFDQRGIWVDRGCRAEFTVNAARGGGGGYGGNAGNTITCSSDNGKRVYCDADTRGRNVQLVRQISGSPCRQGETWGWDRRGIWVDRGCRAEFSIGR
jgi:hypothetical protein